MHFRQAARTKELSCRPPRDIARHVCLLATVLLVAASGGCMTGCREYIANGFKVGPNYRKPAVPISDNWIDSRDQRISNDPPIENAWWQVFRDPVLDALVQNAYAQNLTLREAGFRVVESRAILGIAVGNWFPQTQQAVGAYSRQQLSQEVGFVAGGGGPGFPRNFSVWSGGAQLAWELDFWGRFRRSIEAADAELDASVENYDDVLVVLLSDVAEAYVDIRTLEQRIRYAVANVGSQTGSLDLANIKLDEGAASKLDVTEAKSNVAQTEATIPVFETRLRQAQNRLCVLMGMPPQDLTRLLGTTTPIPRAPPMVAVGIPAELIRRRPDVRRAERLVAAQSARIGIAESDMYPAFTINGSIFVRASQFSDLFKGSAIGGNVGPSFNWNILNYGRLRNYVAVEQSRFMQLATSYQNVVLNANREAEDSIVAFLKSQRQAQILREGVKAAEESRNLVNALYRGGRADFGRVFFAEYFLVQQQDALAQSEGEIALSLVRLYRALGGGWQIRLDPAGAGSWIEPVPLPDVNQQELPAPEAVPPPPPNPFPGAGAATPAKTPQVP
ncbi:MAG: efflux transporter outer membrane subunit [Planctomycetota bacterium]|nr:efflux transporter outer membrane subunit [Planctomycetota bacterium]